MSRCFFVLLVIFFFEGAVRAWPVNTDSVTPASYASDSGRMSDSFIPADYTNEIKTHPPFTSGDKNIINDIQQYHPARRNSFIFILLLLLIVLITYLKTAFSNDLSDQFQYLFSRNTAQQIFRSRTKEISFSSAVLNMNFIVTICLFVYYSITHNSLEDGQENISAIPFMIILFTFFYLIKIAAMKFIGTMFETAEACDEYIFNFTTICKIAGLALLPALLVLYTTGEKFFLIIFALVVLTMGYLLLLFVWRGLSTGYKLMYRSVYHFFLYVCVVEISPIFLLFKLLTKTII